VTNDPMEGARLIRSCHPYAYKSGEWGQIVGMSMVDGRGCWDVVWPDGSVDTWPFDDDTARYEYKTDIKMGGANA
jgi:hypothetical protein